MQKWPLPDTIRREHNTHARIRHGIRSGLDETLEEIHIQYFWKMVQHSVLRTSRLVSRRAFEVADLPDVHVRLRAT